MRNRLQDTVEQRDRLLRTLKAVAPFVYHPGAVQVANDAIRKVEYNIGVQMTDLREDDR